MSLLYQKPDSGGKAIKLTKEQLVDYFKTEINYMQFSNSSFQVILYKPAGYKSLYFNYNGWEYELYNIPYNLSIDFFSKIDKLEKITSTSIDVIIYRVKKPEDIKTFLDYFEKCIYAFLEFHQIETFYDLDFFTN